MHAHRVGAGVSKVGGQLILVAGLDWHAPEAGVDDPPGAPLRWGQSH